MVGVWAFYEIDSGRLISLAFRSATDPIPFGLSEKGLVELSQAQREYVDETDGHTHYLRFVDGELVRYPHAAQESSMEEMRAEKILQLEAETKRFVEHSPVLGKRYTQEKQASFNAICQVCMMFLADPNTPAQDRAGYESRIQKLLAAMGWISAVLNYHYDILGQLRDAESPGELDAIVWDLSAFEQSDPDIRLEEVRL